MKIFNASGVEILDAIVEDNSYRYRAIMGEHSLTLYYSLPEHVEIPIGSYCDFQGERFTLKRPENIKKHHTRDFAYTLILDSGKSKVAQYKFRDTEGRLKFSLTAKPIDHLRMVVDNMNRRESGWAVGTCIDAVEKTISYNHASCLDVLGQLSSEFETEYEVVGKVISLRKVEYNKEAPLALSYGKGNGFKSGVGRVNDGDKPPVGILFVQGGDKNIDFSKHGSRDLLLPIEQSFVYDGKEYITDKDGLSLSRKNNQNPSNEGSLDLSHIYPSRTGTVSSVTVVDEAGSLYDFTDSSIPEELDFSELQIEGETLTVVFQSGILAGREFEVSKYVHKEESDEEGDEEGDVEIIDTRRFELAPAEIDGVTMPNSTFKPKIGDMYAVFGMMMPGSYICNNATQSGASWDMFKEAARYLSENEDFKFTFTGELDGIWSKKDWLRIGGKIKLGGYVQFTDTQFQPDGILIRITGIKDYINKPYSPIIELATSISGPSIKTDIDKIKPNEQEVEEYHKDSIRFTKRRFRDALETITMLEESLLDFSGSINPITVRAMQLLVGDESLQFRFVTSKTAPSNKIHQITMDNETKTLTVDAGIIQHLTLGIKNISNEHKASDYKYWDLAQYVSPPLIESDKRYYLYARVSKTDESGEFLLSENAIKIDESAGYYHLLTGILNSEHGGERSFVTLYGFTEILPGRITTDKIVSADGKTYIDLVNSIIGGKIRFLSNGIEKDLADWVDSILDNLDNTDQTITDLEDYLNDAFKDGLIEEAEAKAIETYINQIQSEKAGVEATYNKLYVNPILKGTAKTNLLNSKVSYFGAVEDLTTSINAVIADGKVTTSEKQSINAIFGTYRSALASFSTRIEEAKQFVEQAIKSIADDAKDAADNAQSMSSDALAAVNTVKAITDKFGTTIDGGLISTVITFLRGFNSTTETAGLSGIQGSGKKDPAFWAGGTYAQAFGGTAKAIIRHDGTVKFNDAEITGKVTARSLDNSISGVFGGGDYPILVGSDNPETAKFKVFKDGTSESAGVFRGSFGYRSAGNPTSGELRGTQNVYVKYTPPNEGTVYFTLPGGNAVYEGTVLNLMFPAHTSAFYLLVKDGIYVGGTDVFFKCRVMTTDKFVCIQVICFKNENNQYVWEVLNAYSKVRGTITAIQ